MDAPKTVTILGPQEVRIPPQFAVREELILAYNDAGSFSARQRVNSAVIGLCTPLGKAAKVDYVRARFDVLAYGGAMYGYLREQGASMADVATAAKPILEYLDKLLFPSEAEVVAEANFMPPTGARTE